MFETTRFGESTVCLNHFCWGIVLKQPVQDFVGESVEKTPIKINKKPSATWGFPKIVVPQNGWFIREKPIKMDDLGVPLFLETPTSSSSSPHPLGILQDPAPNLLKLHWT